jgi:hypothetical protein
MDTPDDDLEPHEALAVAVIRRAVDDLQTSGDPRRRTSAASFLNGRGLDFWCEVAGVRPDAVRAVLRRSPRHLTCEHV